MIKIKDSDILWGLYQKAYTIQGEPVAIPRNLCSYFWTSMFGGLLSILTEAPLWFLWLLALMCVSTNIWLVTIAENAVTNFGAVAACLGMFGVIVITVGRAVVWLGRHIKISDWLADLLTKGFGITLMVVWICVFANALYPKMPHSGVLGYGEAAGSTVGLLLAALAGLFAVVGILFLMGQFIFRPMAGWRFLQQCWSMLKAWKAKACPLVEAPDTFLTITTLDSPRQSLSPGTS